MSEVVITGVGLTAASGHGPEALWEAVLAARPLLAPLSGHFARIPPGVGAVSPFTRREARQFWDPRTLRASTMTRNTMLGCLAAVAATRDAGLSIEQPRPEAGCYVGSFVYPPEYPKQARASLAGVRREGDGVVVDDTRLDKVIKVHSAFDFLRSLPNMVASHAAIAVRFQGPSNSYLGSAASGLSAIHEAGWAIRRQIADTMVAGGASCPFEEVYASWTARRGILAPIDGNPARPWTDSRDGAALGEGAALFLLESEEGAANRGARVHAVLEDGGHSFGPPGSAEEREALEGLLTRLRGEEPPDLVVLAGIGHPRLDALEAEVVHATLPGVPVVGLGGLLGYTGPAHGPLGLAVAIGALRHGVIPPTAGVGSLDPALPEVALRREAEPAGLRSALVLAVSEDGVHSALRIRRSA